jgi:hypothetical protein
VRIGLALALGCSLYGCALPTTQIVLVVDADEPVPSVVSELKITLFGPTGGMLEMPVYATLGEGGVRTPIALPATLGVTPRASPDEAITFHVATFGAGDTTVAREVRTAFVEDETRMLFVTLEGACRAPRTSMQCPAEQTCVGGACTSIDVPPQSLVRCDGDIEDCVARGP